MIAALVVTLLAQTDLPAEKGDQVQVLRGQATYELDWSDAEDRLHGTLRPLDPVAGQPLEVSVVVGTFQGAEFDGPLTLTFRCEGWSDTKTVSRAKGEKAWFVRFTPEADGECSGDLGFTTTRHKRVHWKVNVLEAPLSRTPWYVILGLLLVTAFGLGIRAVFKPAEGA